MSENSQLLTVALASSQAACLSAWLQKCTTDVTELAEASILTAFAAQLDDARWLGRWLREEARLGVYCEEARLISPALRQSLQRLEATEAEQRVVNQLVSQLDRGVSAQSAQFSCPAPVLLASADAAS